LLAPQAERKGGASMTRAKTMRAGIVVAGALVSPLILIPASASARVTRSGERQRAYRWLLDLQPVTR
jgi:hypothetical protein